MAISLNDLSTSRRDLSRRGRKLDFGDQRYCHSCQFPQHSRRARIIVDFQRGSSLQEVSWCLSAEAVKNGSARGLLNACKSKRTNFLCGGRGVGHNRNIGGSN
jgi:hypothetical protein